MYLFVIIFETKVSQLCYIYALMPCLHTSVINSFVCLLFSGPGTCYLFAILTQQLTARLEPKQNKITDEHTEEQNTHTLTLIEVSPPWGCCSLKTWATMCSVEGCNRIRREASPTITYLPIGDRLTEMALGPMKRKGVISLTGWHPSPCFILTASSFPSSIPIMYDMPCSFLNGVEKNKETCTSTNFVRHFLAASILPLRQWSSSRNKRLRLRSSPVPAPYMSRPYHKLLPSSTIFVAGWKANKIFPITTITDVQTIAFLTEGWVLR